jgi:putative endonuclease
MVQLFPGLAHYWTIWTPAFAGVTTRVRAQMERQPCVYILASGKHGTLYIGVTSNLMGRLWQHREKIVKGFTSRHDVFRLVYFEQFGEMDAAILREKRLKKWNRDWKVRLIEEDNPEWHDLSLDWGFEPKQRRR